LICSSTEPTYKVLINPILKIKLDYPNGWINSNNERCEGISGFFQVSAFYSDKTLEDVCRSEAFHKLMPYGSTPTIKVTTINDCPCCFILPDSEQIPDMRTQSAFIIKYKFPLIVKENEYNYLLLWADKNHIYEIANSLQFIE
jgi:TolB protein